MDFYSLATGDLTDAFGDNSSTFGRGTRSNAYASTSIGRYNTGQGDNTNWVGSDPIFEVGIGLNSLNRENALTVLKNGTISFVNYTFPIGDGTANQFLKTDGSGNLFWESLILNNNSIQDNDGDTLIEFNNNSDKILFTTDGNTVAKMELDSMFIDGTLRVGETGPSNIYLGQTYSHQATNNNYIIKNNTTDKNNLVINNQGEIGIGLNNPGDILDVGAPNDLDGIRIFGGSNNAQVQLKLDNNSSLGREYILRSTGANASQGGGKFLIRDNEVGTTRFTIDSVGKIGLGTLNPEEKLHVAGDVKVNGLSGSGTASVMVDLDGKLIRGEDNITYVAYIDFVDFQPTLQDDIYYHMLEGVYLTDGSGTMLGSLSGVPDEATITEIKVYYMDNLTNTSQNIDFSILSYDGSSNQVIVETLGFSTSAGSVRTSTTYSNVNYLLDRTTYNYAFSASSQDWGTSMKMFSVEITYTL